jgi:hypothetical protein
VSAQPYADSLPEPAGRTRRPEGGRARRVRLGLAVLTLALGTYLIAVHFAHGSIPSLSYLLVLMTGIALLANRGGTFARDWLPIYLVLLLYSAAGSIVGKLELPIHYHFQIDAERFLFGGTVPTLWLQQHLYHGHTGPLEVLMVLMYVSHFLVPLALAFTLWWTRRTDALRALLRSILVVSALGEAMFVLLPTAPPWLAADRGYLPRVHPIFKLGLQDMGLGGAAVHVGSAGAYDIVAAMPSLHAAWPLVGLIIARRYKLGWKLSTLLSLQLVGVLFAIVYGGEHYVVDALGGWLFAAVAVWIAARYWSHDRFALPAWIAACVRRRRARVAPAPRPLDA